jgi:rhodanese-related sulfurtransferase
MHEGKEILILDVRPPDVRAAEGIIPGAVPAHPAEINTVIGYSGERETIVYCACPNEASAATVAKHLRASRGYALFSIMHGSRRSTLSSVTNPNTCLSKYDAPCRGLLMLRATTLLPLLNWTRPGVLTKWKCR